MGLAQPKRCYVYATRPGINSWDGFFHGHCNGAGERENLLGFVRVVLPLIACRNWLSFASTEGVPRRRNHADLECSSRPSRKHRQRNSLAIQSCAVIPSDHIDDSGRFIVSLWWRKHCFSFASAACGTSARGVLGGKRDIRVGPDARSPRRLLFRRLVWAAN